MAEWKNRYGERNNVVHNIWGHSDDHPDLAIRIAAKDFAEVWKATSAAGDVLALHKSMDVVAELWRVCEAWRIEDLEDVEARLDSYEVRIAQLWQRLFTQQYEVMVPNMTGPAPLSDMPTPDSPTPE